jgi:hypothetical protein
MTGSQKQNVKTERDFMVVFTVRPGTRLPDDGEAQLNFPDATGRMDTVIIRNLMESDQSGNVIPVGLKFAVKTRGGNIDDAIKKAKAVADAVVSFATFCNAVGLPTVREDLSYEITAGISDRDFLQLFHDIPVQSSRRELDARIMIDLMGRVFGITDDDSRDRVSRAISWHRRGCLAIDELEKFTWFWTGLETINPLLQEHFNVSDDPIICGNCGNKWMGPSTTSGVRAAVQKLLPNGSALHPRMKELRNGLIHGRTSLQSLRSEASVLQGPTREALVRSVLLLVNMSPTAEFLRESLSAEAPISAAAVATLHGSDPSKLGPPSEHPHLEVESHKIQEAKPSSDGVKTTVTSKLTARLAEGVTIRVHGWRVYGQEMTLDGAKPE